VNRGRGTGRIDPWKRNVVRTRYTGAGGCPIPRLHIEVAERSAGNPSYARPDASVHICTTCGHCRAPVAVQGNRNVFRKHCPSPPMHMVHSRRTARVQPGKRPSDRRMHSERSFLPSISWQKSIRGRIPTLHRLDGWLVWQHRPLHRARLLAACASGATAWFLAIPCTLWFLQILPRLHRQSDLHLACLLLHKWHRCTRP